MCAAYSQKTDLSPFLTQRTSHLPRLNNFNDAHGYLGFWLIITIINHFIGWLSLRFARTLRDTGINGVSPWWQWRWVPEFVDWPVSANHLMHKLPSGRFWNVTDASYASDDYKKTHGIRDCADASMMSANTARTCRTTRESPTASYLQSELVWNIFSASSDANLVFARHVIVVLRKILCKPINW